jgi:hypothetical protein
MDRTTFWIAPIPHASMSFACRLLDYPLDRRALLPWPPRLVFALPCRVGLRTEVRHLPIIHQVDRLVCRGYGTIHFSALLVTPVVTGTFKSHLLPQHLLHFRLPLSTRTGTSRVLGPLDLACMLCALHIKEVNGISRMPRGRRRRVATFSPVAWAYHPHAGFHFRFIGASVCRGKPRIP